MIWIIQLVVVSVLIYFMVDGYRAIKERKRLDRMMSEVDAKIRQGQEERRRFDEEVQRVQRDLTYR